MGECSIFCIIRVGVGTVARAEGHVNHRVGCDMIQLMTTRHLRGGRGMREQMSLCSSCQHRRSQDFHGGGAIRGIVKAESAKKRSAHTNLSHLPPSLLLPDNLTTKLPPRFSPFLPQNVTFLSGVHLQPLALVTLLVVSDIASCLL